MTEYDRVFDEISCKIDQQLNESHKIYQSLSYEEKCKWDKLQAKLDELCKINFTPISRECR